MALADNVVLVLHRLDLMEGGLRAFGAGGGYGERSSMLGSRSVALNGAGASSREWREKAASKKEGRKSLTCAKCCATLGYASERDPDTFRLYKHLLDCGASSASAFRENTVASFLAREMVRHAESEAIYTFVVGVSDENDWTRLGAGTGKGGGWILLRMLGWDAAMATLAGSGSDDCDDSASRELRFRKAVKVIYEVTSGREDLAAATGDDSLGWTWGVDLCCPPAVDIDGASSEALRSRATSITIYFSQREWTELRDALVRGSGFFSEAVKDAVVAAKLGSFPGNGRGRAAASLSVLPLVD